MSGLQRHAGYVQRSMLTDEERERYDRELTQAYQRLGRDSPLVRSAAYQAGMRARIVRERSGAADSRPTESNQREEARP